MSIIDWIAIGACVVLVCLPPKWDPAIRLKEWMMRHDR